MSNSDITQWLWPIKVRRLWWNLTSYLYENRYVILKHNNLQTVHSSYKHTATSRKKFSNVMTSVVHQMTTRNWFFTLKTGISKKLKNYPIFNRLDLNSINVRTSRKLKPIHKSDFRYKGSISPLFTQLLRMQIPKAQKWLSNYQLFLCSGIYTHKSCT